MPDNSETPGLHTHTVKEAIDLLEQVHKRLEDNDYDTAQAMISIVKLMIDFLHRDIEAYFQVTQMLQRQMNSDDYNPQCDRFN